MKSFCFIVDSWLKLIVRRLGLFSLCFCVSAVQIFSQDWKSVADGVEYAQVRREFSGKAVDVNLLRLDLKKVRLDVHHALDRAIGLETTSSIAKRKGAIAAINAGFFRLDKSIWTGDSSGLLKIDGKIVSESLNNRVALALKNKPSVTEAAIIHFDIRSVIKIGEKEWKVWGINRELEEKDIVIYTPEFHSTTLTRPGVYELAVSKGKVIGSVTEAGNSVIPSDGFIIAATGGYSQDLDQILKLGKKVSISHSLRSPEFGEFGRYDFIKALVSYINTEDIVAGVPQLIEDGKIDITWEQEKASKSFVETRHPRTAVAKLKDGKFLMLTADGRSEQSAGLDLYDLAKYMLELGGVDAMNLDGGGSTTMFLDGKVVNRPSDKDGERKVGDAIVVTLRKKKS